MQIATILWPAVFIVVGALVYALAANPKASEMGRLANAFGVCWLVYELAHGTLRISG